MNGADVLASAAAMGTALAPHTDRDWSAVPVPGLGLSVGPASVPPAGQISPSVTVEGPGLAFARF